MGYSFFMMKFFAPLFLENKVATTVYAQKLEGNGLKIEQRFRDAGESDATRKVLRHIIAIERWGLNRLRVLLGEKTFVLDSSQAYEPSHTSAWNALIADFKDTRRELVALSPFLENTNSKVTHNGLGDLSAKAWLKYLDFHANAESTKARPQK